MKRTENPFDTPEQIEAAMTHPNRTTLRELAREPGSTTPLPYDRLCWYDPRNPDYIAPEDGGDADRQPRVACACDNCFYGRDALALRIIGLVEALLNVRDNYLALDETDVRRIVDRALAGAA